MRIAMLLYLIHLIYFSVFEVSASDVAKPTIINSTGEYYITNTTISFYHQTIECNSSIPTCFVVCDGYDSCLGTTIRAPNSNNASLYLSCSEEGACGGAEIYGSENPDSLLHIECSGQSSCYNVKIDTMRSNQSSIECSDLWSCCGVVGQVHSSANMSNISYLSIRVNASGTCSNGNYGLAIIPSDFTILDLEFYGFAIATHLYKDWVAVYRSSLNNMTSITCHDATSCINLCIVIPPSSRYEFNANVVVSGQNIDTFGYSYFNIYCSNDTHTDRGRGWKPIDCTNDTGFPIFDIAEPSNSSGNSVYYISEDLYWFRYQTIILDEKGSNVNDYVIECNHNHSCSQTFIQFTATVDSNCAISCRGNDSCAGYKVYSMPTNNSNISMLCQGHNVCSYSMDSVDAKPIPLVQYQYPSITALSGHSLTFSLNDTTSHVGHPVFINGSAGLSMYIDLIRLDMCDTLIRINGTNAKALHLKLDKSISNALCVWWPEIYGPISEQAIFDLSCANGGCLQLYLWFANDLSHVNVSFTGDCDQCHLDDRNITNCIWEWYLRCWNETLSHYHYDELVPGTNGHSFRCHWDKTWDYCCTDDDAKRIQNAYSEYWVGFECPNTSKGYETLLIILISGGCALFCLFVLLIVWCKYCKKKYQGAATEYHPINKT